MAGNAYPAALRRVIVALSRWPGVGEKTASRLAMHLLRAPESEVLELANALMELKARGVELPQLGNMEKAWDWPVDANGYFVNESAKIALEFKVFQRPY